MARLTAIVALVAALAIPAATGAASKSPAFGLGTYSGKTDACQQQGAVNPCGDFAFKLRKGSCYIRRQVQTLVKGYCFTLKKFPDVVAGCPDGSKETRLLYEYDVKMSASGKYSDTSTTSTGGGAEPLEVLKLKFAAKGKKLTGTVDYEATSNFNTTGKRDCFASFGFSGTLTK